MVDRQANISTIAGMYNKEFSNSGYPWHRENMENGKNNSVRVNTGNLEILPKHGENKGNLVCSSCKFPYAKGKGYCDICRKNFHFFPEAG